MRGGVAFTGTFALVSFFGLFNTFQPLWATASAICLSPGWELNILRVNVGVTFPDYPNTMVGLPDFHGKLNDPAASVWAQVGDGQDWFKLLEVGLIRRTSKFGTSCDHRRDPAVPAGVSGLPHLCRRNPCGFFGGSRSADGVASGGKKALAVHVTRVAFAWVN